jgi:pimeloyl-ACP methyl ester carboxylesterase
MIQSECTPETPPTQPAPPPPPPSNCPHVVGGANLLFQHGILSDGGTWWRMEPWMRCAFLTGQSATPTVNWFWSIDNQRDELRPQVPADMQQAILIGHSNGGLVSRAYAQWAQQQQPGRVRGVVTLDSPNQGAMVAINARALQDVVGTGIFGPVVWPLIDLFVWHPFYEDDVPGSAFLTRTNNFAESFTRVGIQTHTRKRWVAWRILWTPGDCVPESPCGERAVERRIQQAYDRHRHYSKFWYRPWQSVPALVAMAGMNGADAVWNGLTAPNGLSTDGFIHGPGQVYPNAMRNRLINNGDSHVGTTRSDFVQARLFETLRQDFGVVERNP